MHELSIATSLLEIAGEELSKHGASRLISLRVHYGPLSNLLPEALAFAFESLTLEGKFKGALLEIRQDPLVLNCGECRKDFTPEDSSLFSACPFCSCEFFHQVVSGNEIYLDNMEAE